MRLLVCGGRDFLDVEYAVPRLMRVHQKTPVTALVNGLAKGGDAIAKAWATELGIPVEGYAADWKGQGKAAGPIRNQKMIDEGKLDLVIGLPGGTGTAHMCRIAREAGVPVIEYRYVYFKKEDPVYGFLSNFYPSAFPENDIIFRSNEHYYQSEKTLDRKWKQQIIEAEDARIAKKLGNAKNLPLREDWDTHKLVAMMNGLRLKFPDNATEISDRLRFTGDEYLVEYAPWGDAFWGVDKNYQGQNWLGRLLMRRRDEIMTGRTLYA